MAACNNNAAREFFKQRSNMPTNLHKNALAYRQGRKNRWMVWPTPSGAAVLQINRFEGDEAIWGKLSNPNMKPWTSVHRANLRFDLTKPSDFELFKQVVEEESAPTLSWVKP